MIEKLFLAHIRFSQVNTHLSMRTSNYANFLIAHDIPKTRNRKMWSLPKYCTNTAYESSDNDNMVYSSHLLAKWHTTLLYRQSTQVTNCSMSSIFPARILYLLQKHHLTLLLNMLDDYDSTSYDNGCKTGWEQDAFPSDLKLKSHSGHSSPRQSTEEVLTTRKYLYYRNNHTCDEL